LYSIICKKLKKLLLQEKKAKKVRLQEANAFFFEKRAVTTSYYSYYKFFQTLTTNAQLLLHLTTNLLQIFKKNPFYLLISHL
jgi:hypothetical protein